MAGRTFYPSDLVSFRVGSMPCLGITDTVPIIGTSDYASFSYGGDDPMIPVTGVSGSVQAISDINLSGLYGDIIVYGTTTVKYSGGNNYQLSVTVVNDGSTVYRDNVGSPSGGDAYRFGLTIWYTNTADEITIPMGIITSRATGTTPPDRIPVIITITDPGGLAGSTTLFASQLSDAKRQQAAKDIYSQVSPLEPIDPFAPGGGSETGGGNGTFDGSSDSNPIPGDPAISATDTGFMTVFATNTAGLRSLANSLWSDLFSAISPGGTLEGTVEALKNMVASPYDAILGCHILPVSVPVGVSKRVKMYGVLPTEVSLPVASTQWVHKDCGSLTIQPYDGSYLDYAPYSKVTSLYLPFVGVVSVDIDIIMNTTIGVYYKIDIISGQCIVYITKDNNVYFQYQGQCAVPIPVTSIDWSNTVSAGLGLIGSVTGIVGSAVGGALSGGPAGALAGAVTGTIGQAGAMAQNVMNSKPDIKAGSGVGGSAALLGCKTPYLIIERPKKSTPLLENKGQNHWTGYPSNIAANLGDLEGYTEVSRVYVNHMNATEEEKAEIEQLLNNGVILPKKS